MANYFDKFDNAPAAENYFDKFDAKPIAPPPPSTERTFGEAAQDIGAAALEGAGGLAQFPGQLYGLTTGAITEPDFATTGLYGAGQRLEKYGASLKSTGLQAREAASEKRVAEAEKEGQISAGLQQIQEIATDPAQLPTFLVKQSVQSLPSILVALVPFIGPAAAAELRVLQLAAKTATTAAARQAAEAGISKIAANAAAKQALGVAATQQGSDIGTGTYEDAYKHLIKTGVSAPDAAEQALSLARKAGASAAVISALTQSLPGAQAMERAIAGGRSGAGGRLLQGLGIGAKEAITEIPEEVGGRAARNVAMMQIDPTQTLTQGLGVTAGQAAVGGFGMGAVTGLATGKQGEDIVIKTKAEEANEKAAADFEAIKNKRLAEIAKEPVVPTAEVIPAEMKPTETTETTEAAPLLALPAPTAKIAEPAAISPKAEAAYRNVLDQLKTEVQGTGIQDFTPEEVVSRLTNLLQKQAAPAAPVQGVEAPAVAPQITQLAQALYDNAIKQGDIEVSSADNAPLRVTVPTYETKLPGNFEVRKEAFKAGEEPESYEIRSGSAVLSKAKTAAEAKGKAERATGYRQAEATRIQKQIASVQADAKKNQDIIERMEALGESATPEYAESVANDTAFQAEIATLLPQLETKLADLQSSPITVEPIGMQPISRMVHTVYANGKPTVTFPTREAAEEHVLANLPEPSLKQLSAAKKPHKLTKRATDELQARLNKKADIKAPRTGVSQPTREAITGLKETRPVVEEVSLEDQARKEQLDKLLSPLLKQMGLGHVALEAVRAINNNADGSYAAKLIRIAFDAKNPVRVLKHESIHALKELGFFTPQQWKALEDQAIKSWIGKYLGDVKHVREDGTVTSRLQAYKDMGLSNEELMEEAIADAFGDFDATKAPSGMLSALLNRLRQFFNALRSAVTGAGYDNADEVFGKITRGELKEAVTPAEPAEEKLSLSGEGVPLSTRGIMDRQTTVAQQELGLNTEAVRNRFNNVRQIAIALNENTLTQFGAMDRNNLTQQQATEIAKAIADEVAYQLRSTSKTGTGLGWYSNNYPKAVKRLAERFPELGSNEHAQSVFSALVAVTSNGEKVTKNIDNAIKLYAELREGKPLVAMGNRRATALENNLITIQNLLQEYGTDFKKVLLKEMTVKEMNAKLREMGEESDGSYLADTVVPAAAVYFGPKLGAFYANLSGSEGYLTMDLWWTRSINRMRGLLMPQATEASIEKFRDMMDQPLATRDEVVAATIPLRNKYEEFGWNTELEHLVKSKEPSTKANKAAWFEKAKRKAGSSYQQLFFEHKLEKMANTIYKNEFEMLEEAPFTATDRRFMYDAARKAQQILRNEDINLTLADVQAALWYYEKRLYEKLSGKKADDIGYEEAIIAQAHKGTGRARPSVVFPEQQDGRAKPTGEVPVSEELRGELASGEKLSLRAPDTEAFKRWFGDSKVVDEDGQPLVMYHGTAGDFSTFDSEKGRENRKSFFVTEYPELASRFSGSELTIVDGGSPNVMPVFVRAENPFDYENVAHIAQIESYEKENRYTDRSISNDVSMAKRGEWSAIESRRFQAAIKALGFDSFYVKEGTAKNLGLFEPTQIKSATGNIGTYDATNPDIRYSLRDQLSQLPSAAAIETQVNDTTTARVEVGHAARMIDALSSKHASKYRQAFLNRYNQIGVYGKAASKALNDDSLLLADASAESAALMSDNAASIAAEALGVGNRKGGIPIYENGYFTVEKGTKGAVEIFAPLAKKGDPLIYQYYQYWSGVKRGSRFVSEGREQLFTDPASIKYAAEIEAMFPEFVTVQKEWITYNNGLVKMMVAAGVITEAEGVLFTKHGDYLPFYRQLDGEQTVGPNIFQSIAGVKPPKKLKGGEAPLGDFLENVVRNTQASIEASMKNVAAQRAIRDAVTLGTATELTHVATGIDVVPVFQKGKKTFYRVADPLWIEAIQGLNLPAIPMLGVLAMPADLLRTMVTKDPAFMLANMLRDSLSTWVTSGAKMTPIVGTIANFGKALAGMDPTVGILHRAGLGGGFDFAGNVESSAREFSKTLRQATKTKTAMEKLTTPVTGLWQVLEKGSEASELATRVSVYKSTLEKTGNEAEAIYQAMEVLNFNRKGNSPLIRILTAAVPFLNARMQGLDVLYRAAFGVNANKDVKQKQRAFFVRGATIMALSVLYVMAMQDDDDYNKQEQEVRDNYWLFPKLGIKIPIPFELGILFKVIPERIYMYAFGTDTGKDFRQSMGRQIMTTLSVNPIPQTLMPYVEAKTNFSFFTQRPIVPRELADIDPKFQVASNTSNLAKRIGEQLNMSPIQIDHLISGYTGTMGMYAVQSLNAIFEGQNDPVRAALRMEQLPVWKRFAVDPEARGQVSAYYELKHETDAMVRTVNILEASHQYAEMAEYQQDNLSLLATKSYVKVLDKRMTELQGQKKLVQNSSMDAEGKRDALLAITRAQNAITSNTKTLRKMMSETF